MASSLVPGRPFLYETQNWMRLTTGMFHGITLGSVMLLVFINRAVWANPDQLRTIDGLRDTAVIMLAGRILIALVLPVAVRQDLENTPGVLPLAMCSRNPCVYSCHVP